MDHHGVSCEDYEQYLLQLLNCMYVKGRHDFILGDINKIPVQRVFKPHNHIVMRYLKLLSEKDQEATESDRRKLKITSFLLHVSELNWLAGVDEYEQTAAKYSLHTSMILQYGIKTKVQFFRVRECAACQAGGVKGEFMKCGRCFSAYYCDVNCQRSDWKNGHKTSCCKPKTKYDLLRSKEALAWTLFLKMHTEAVVKYCNMVQSETNKKSKVLIPLAWLPNPSEPQWTMLQLQVVSLRLLKHVNHDEDVLAIDRQLKNDHSLYLLLLPRAHSLDKIFFKLY